MKSSIILVVLSLASSLALTIDTRSELNTEVETSPLVERESLEELAARTTATCSATAVSQKMKRIMARTVNHCGFTGVAATPMAPDAVMHGITQQQCADMCICDHAPMTGECRSFSWTPNNRGLNRGECEFFSKHLTYQNIHHGRSPSSTTYWDRVCYHRSRPQTTGVHTTAQPQKTGTPFVEKRSPLDVYMAGHLAGV